jgi:hypothetical protein
VEETGEEREREKRRENRGVQICMSSEQDMVQWIAVEIERMVGKMNELSAEICPQDKVCKTNRMIQVYNE